MIPNSMKALVATDYRGPASVRIAQLPVPAPGAGEVLIRAGASALNFLDLLMLEGKYQVKPPIPFVPGRDLAGEVVAVGAGVTGLAVGQRVAAQPAFGAFAEYAVAPDYACQPLPDLIDDVVGAASGIVVATVVGALALRGRVARGQRVLITGAAGGVGTAAIQYATELGAVPVALVSSAAKAEATLRLGATVSVRSDLLSSGKGALRDALKGEGIDDVDVVVDMVGGPNVDGLLRCLKPGGRFVIVGFASGHIPMIPANYLLLKDIEVHGSSLDRLFRTRDPDLANGIREAFNLLETGRMKAAVDVVLPFEDFAEGARRLAARETVGKVVFKGF
ncbi:zinc-binding dehydrogenase [Xanthobacter autotrophicus]|uniref:zinc-binding dehydrogenase n=1 Tax=Xanthobacter autotrophicus TaxID=280 RepID=UPI001E47F7B2|nr:zinc-binding dehydrogenase [Xanthobacter autotrophicus]UDQ91054.1 zinc-binding dehydrogenase [Xanthobacter autotrophicus]